MNVRHFGDHCPRLAHGVFVDPSAVVIGDVALGKNVSIWPGAVLRGDIAGIRIGAGSNIQDGSILHVTHDGPYSPGGMSLAIGEQVTVGHRAVLHGCTIGNRCLVGIGAIVLDGAVVEDDVMIGAGALIPSGKRLESGQLYLGAPARPIRPLTERERAFLIYSAGHYVQLAAEHRRNFGV